MIDVCSRKTVEHFVTVFMEYSGIRCIVILDVTDLQNIDLPDLIY